MLIYTRTVAGMLGEDAASIPVSTNGHDITAADHARKRLAEMRAALQRSGEDGAVLQAVMSVCVEGAWTPWVKRFLARGTGYGNGAIRGDFRALGNLRQGLQRLTELDDHRIRRTVSPARAAAE